MIITPPVYRVSQSSSYTFISLLLPLTPPLRFYLEAHIRGNFSATCSGGAHSQLVGIRGLALLSFPNAHASPPHPPQFIGRGHGMRVKCTVFKMINYVKHGLFSPSLDAYGRRILIQRSWIPWSFLLECSGSRILHGLLIFTSQ